MLLKTDHSEIKKIIKEGSSRIAPLWSLENFVAVNPYLGMAEMKFEEAMSFITKTSDAQVTLPKKFYLKAIETGHIDKNDVSQAIADAGYNQNSEEFISKLSNHTTPEEPTFVQTLADIASEVNSKKWNRFMIDRVSFWASAYFDQNQASWKTSEKSESLFEAWKKESEIDFSTEAMGLIGFRKLVKSLPNNYLEASAYAIEKLKIQDSIQNYYLNALLMKMNGWAGFAARIDWDANLAGVKSQALEEFLAILLVWELCLYELLHYEDMEDLWNQAKIETEIIANSGIDDGFASQMILQKAFDIANQRSIITKINNQENTPEVKIGTEVQAVFCIDVRSETFRRNLEGADGSIETLGFAGFFGFPIKYVPLGHQEGAEHCPVLITTSHTVKESLNDPQEDIKAIASRTLKEKFLKTWKVFKSGAVSCFGFVSPLGLFFLPKLFTDLFGITRPVPNPAESGLSKKTNSSKGVSLDKDPSSDILGIPMEDQIKMGQTALKAMSLTSNFAPVVLITGHGASTVNNPHATGLDCGACGGHSGESNAKVAAAILNNAEVRSAIKATGIDIPDSTIFIAGLHDTTIDKVTLFRNNIDFTNDQLLVINALQHSLELAGEATRRERATRMMINSKFADKAVLARSKDWSQVRPEWGLAGCSSFIVAPRERTSQLNLGGKAFMHSYKWKEDENFNILEVIMTAPMVVTSWINLQYFASTVDNKRFGAGNKALHNVVGGLGVLEGFSGDLRVGLPWQSVHDGTKYQHEPNRLNVIIEAPVDEMSKILKKHESIRNLCDNEWIYLFAINEYGKVAYRYKGNLEWEVVDQ